MKPMFSYYGSKYKCAKHYGAPRSDTVIEPFAGSAAYSLFWEPKKVILIEKSNVISGIWEYLINADPARILALPTDFNHVDDVDWHNADERALVGFWLGKGKVTPGKSRSKWGREYANAPDCKVWNEAVKRRLAAQVEKIRHWQVIRGDYTVAPDVEAHWFVDPPYNSECGKRYAINDVDFSQLADWSIRRKGYVQVCENEGANWLPFQPFRSVNTYMASASRVAKYSYEVLYEAYGRNN